jgi:hypothetical protein
MHWKKWKNGCGRLLFKIQMHPASHILCMGCKSLNQFYSTLLGDFIFLLALPIHAGKMYHMDYSRPGYTQFFSRIDNGISQRIDKLDMGHSHEWTIFSSFVDIFVFMLYAIGSIMLI